MNNLVRSFTLGTIALSCCGKDIKPAVPKDAKPVCATREAAKQQALQILGHPNTGPQEYNGDFVDVRCRGELVAKMPEPLIRAHQKGNLPLLVSKELCADEITFMSREIRERFNVPGKMDIVTKTIPNQNKLGMVVGMDSALIKNLGKNGTGNNIAVTCVTALADYCSDPSLSGTDSVLTCTRFNAEVAEPQWLSQSEESLCLTREQAKSSVLDLLNVDEEGEQQDKGMHVDVQCQEWLISELPKDMALAYERGRFPLQLSKEMCHAGATEISKEIRRQKDMSEKSMDIKISAPLDTESMDDKKGEGCVGPQTGDNELSPTVIGFDRAFTRSIGGEVTETVVLGCISAADYYCSHDRALSPDSVLGCTYMTTSSMTLNAEILTEL